MIGFGEEAVPGMINWSFGHGTSQVIQAWMMKILKSEFLLKLHMSNKIVNGLYLYTVELF